MPKFVYKAKQGPGKTVEGELSAESRSAAVSMLDSRGLSAVWIKETDEALMTESGAVRTRGIKRKDVTIFTRQLASLIKSGVPILRALSTVASQSVNHLMGKVVEDLEHTIRDGNMLSEALSKYGDMFSELYINMVRAGESAGVLDRMLFRLAEAREKEDEIRRKVQSAMAYPILVIIVGVATVFVLLTFFLPRVAELYKGYSNLPLPTRILVGISGFFSNWWYWIVLGILLVAALVNRLAAMEKGRLFIDRIKLHLPGAGGFLLKQDIARFCRTLSLLIGAGLSIDKAVAASAATLGNSLVRDEIENAANSSIREGLQFSEGLKRVSFIPPLVSNMSAVGEEAGRLDEALTEIASFYENEIDQQSRIVTTLIEPILILVVGCIVGFIVAAMLLPIFRLSSTF